MATSACTGQTRSAGRLLESLVEFRFCMDALSVPLTLPLLTLRARVQVHARPRRFSFTPSSPFSFPITIALWTWPSGFVSVPSYFASSLSRCLKATCQRNVEERAIGPTATCGGLVNVFAWADGLLGVEQTQAVVASLSVSPTRNGDLRFNFGGRVVFQRPAEHKPKCWPSCRVLPASQSRNFQVVFVPASNSRVSIHSQAGLAAASSRSTASGLKGRWSSGMILA